LPSDSEVRAQFEAENPDLEVLSVESGEGDFDNVYFTVFWRIGEVEGKSELLYQRVDGKWSYSTLASFSTSRVGVEPTPIAATKPKLESPCSSYPAEGPVGPFRLTEANGIQPPRQIHYRAPEIASLDLELSEVGVLILEAIISEAGRVEEVQVIRSAHSDFDRMSIDALLDARYEPATRLGEPVAICMAYTVQPHP
jgi:hypothetical protein